MKTNDWHMNDYDFHENTTDQFMKQVILGIMVILGLIITLSIGMIIINWSLNVRI